MRRSAASLYFRSSGSAHSSKHMMMSAPSASCTATALSGVKPLEAAVDVRAEGHAVRVKLAHQRQAEDLEAAGIGEHRAGPAHEAVQAAEIGDQVCAGPQIEVIGVGQHQRRADLVQVARGERLHRGLRADRREDGRLDRAVGRLERPAARRAGGVVGEKGEVEHVQGKIRE